MSYLNDEYADVHIFYDTESSASWDEWRAHLDSKFRSSWELFEERSRFDYIRDHRREIAFEVVKASDTIAEFKPSKSLYIVFATLSVITLMVALDGTSVSVALPVSISHGSSLQLRKDFRVSC